MAKTGRKRDKNSKGTYYNLGFKPETEKRLSELLEEHDISFAQLTRALVKEWVDHDGQGVLKYHE
jgi:hypothetical protein